MLRDSAKKRRENEESREKENTAERVRKARRRLEPLFHEAEKEKRNEKCNTKDINKN